MSAVVGQSPECYHRSLPLLSTRSVTVLSPLPTRQNLVSQSRSNDYPGMTPEAQALNQRYSLLATGFPLRETSPTYVKHRLCSYFVLISS